ncbi:CGNR zinc finger domain-containing protein [Amycolatopsis carbonis]|uniref:CGNR zinc finger domain-containing protein n=1 Tax=Amycolatopsis carbonis TaxID=715471 RepID=A0A9Y2IP74_9PSEU|nr:CGNR zinc finger domain-containing protein [Amycolatopsis sp. 2-15]WIX82233.1 CGNR zinc finger domain-containing protein [Amycolatopsis sp. 2-15]
MEPEVFPLGLSDHPALAFLNTAATAESRELIPHGAGFVQWLELTRLIDEQDRNAVLDHFAPAELDAAAREAVDLRERLRPVVQTWAGGDPTAPDEPFLAALNAILAESGRSRQVRRSGADLDLQDRWTWTTPRSLLSPVAEAAADLFVHGDRSLVRNCEGPECPLWFYDRTKAHRRRWCSMATCGNRAKVREFRARATKEVP